LACAAAISPGNKLGRIVGEVGCNGIGEREFAFAAAEQFSRLLRDERPGHGFHHAARGESPFGAAGAKLYRRQDRLARLLVAFKCVIGT